MERLNRYPRGFLTRVENVLSPLSMTQVQVNDVESDPTSETLYKIYTGGLVNVESWAYRKQAIQRCSQLFGNFYHWLKLQVTANDNIYGLNLEFLLDTVKYIRTGQRDMNVTTWLELLAEYPDQNPGIANTKRLDVFKLKDPKEFDNFIGLWCSYPGGFEDMLCTAHVLFGVAKKPLQPHPSLI